MVKPMLIGRSIRDMALARSIGTPPISLLEVLHAHISPGCSICPGGHVHHGALNLEQIFFRGPIRGFADYTVHVGVASRGLDERRTLLTNQSKNMNTS